MNRRIKENWTTGDISSFGFAFSLVLLGTIVSAYTDHPVFWLLVGPGTLVVGLTLIAFLRHTLTGRRRLAAQGMNLRTRTAWANVPYAKETDEQKNQSFRRSV